MAPVQAGDASHGPEDFRLIVESVKDYAIFMLDPEGRVTTWNAGAERIKGYTADEIIGRHFSVFYPADEPSTTWEDELAEARATGRAEAEGWRVRKDGSRFWATVVITALFGEDGELRGFAKVTRDITERRAANEAIREHERLLAEAQHLAKVGSWEWDVGEDRVTWSDELYRLFEIAPGEFEPTFEGYVTRLHPDDRELARTVVTTALDGGGPFAFDHRILLPGDRIRWVHGRGQTVVDEAGNTIKLQGTAQDITDVKQAEEDRRRLAEVRLRQRHALEVNDDITQGLAVADLALNLDDVEKARDAIAATLDAARRFVTELLGDSTGDVSIGPGDLRRRRTPSGH